MMTQERFTHLLRNPFDGTQEEDKFIISQINSKVDIKEQVKNFCLEQDKLKVDTKPVQEVKQQVTQESNTIIYNDKYLGRLELTKVNLYKTEQEIKQVNPNRDIQEFDKYNKLSTQSNDFVKTIKIHGVNNFMKKYKQEIDSRVQQIREDVRSWNVKENLEGLRSEEEEKYWVVGEMLLTNIFKGEMSEFTFNRYDILFHKQMKVDVKTMKVNFTLDRELWCFDRMFSYFQATQVKEDVVLAPCLINTETDMALIIVNPEKLNWGYIKRNFNPIWENPPGSKLTKQWRVMLNYKIPYKLFDNRKGA